MHLHCLAAATLVFSAVASSALAQARAPLERPDLAVTYIANEGFLLEAGDGKVLVDALFDDGIAGYPRIPDAHRPALEDAEPPFDHVDVVLTTHHHDDHFGPHALVRHLAANAAALFVSTEQAVARAKREARDLDGVAERFRGLFPEEGTTVTLSHRGVQVEILNLHHGRDRDPPVQNLGFVIHLAGWKILHIGDTEATEADFRAYSLADSAIDVALLPAWYLAEPRWIGTVRSQIRPAALVAMHLADPGAPSSWFGSDGSREERVQRIRAEFPAAWIPSEALESKRHSSKHARRRVGE